MTDNEIIKALECCASAYFEQMCPKCPLYTDMNCNCYLAKFSLDLFKRLKAENERLEQENHWFADIGKMYSEVKAEATREFAERLKANMFGYYDCLEESAKGRPYKGDTLMDYEVVDMIEDCVDNLVKEMVGDREVNNGKV